MKRKKDIIEELRNEVNHYLSLLSTVCNQKEELMVQNTELKVENAVLKERLKMNPPEEQEDSKEH